jgi:hypothetical protein
MFREEEVTWQPARLVVLKKVDRKKRLSNKFLKGVEEET